MLSKSYFLVAAVFTLLTCSTLSNAQQTDKVATDPFGMLSHGDFIFQDLSCGPLCDAIESVTPGLNGRQFSHVGLVQVVGDSMVVVEAVSQGGVVRTPISIFLSRTTLLEENVFMRLSPEHTKLLPDVFSFIDSQMGVPYDDAYLIGNGKYYCSELLYDAFRYANEDEEFFRLFPMTFKSPESGKFDPAWVEYYNRLAMPIPEGKPGCNPGGMATSGKLTPI